jgi:hypothetical protein
MSVDFYADNGGNLFLRNDATSLKRYPQFPPLSAKHKYHISVFISGVFYQCGFFLEYLFGSLTDWRTAAGISASIPIFTAIYVALVLYLTFHILLTIRNFLNCRKWSAEWNVRISTDRYEGSILIQCHQCSEIGIDLDVKYARFFFLSIFS